MPERIEIPGANSRNIAIFHDEPDDQIIEEIKSHIRATSSPWTWRGHSHTKPPLGAAPQYVEEFDVPAPDSVHKVAPCPCCNPRYPQYKNKGKIAWFPDEAVIRLIGPQCYAKINAAAHGAALVDLRRRQKRRADLATVGIHGPKLKELLAAIDEAMPIAEGIDRFAREFNGAVDNLRLNLWREVKEGRLTISETRRVQYRKPDGSFGERNEEFRSPFATIAGHGIFDRPAQSTSNKLRPLRAGLAAIAERLGNTEPLADEELGRVADGLPKGRAAVSELLAAMAERQKFLTSNAIEVLGQWGQHPSAPIRLGIQRKRESVVIWSGRSAEQKAYVLESAIRPIPEVPKL